ncbi:hypothetical protein M422DRAFT_243088 [Sphaerobolus stellatus SS14]|nr:hypothetical protein M422DRAFT_243088 [Sphaerobolus stellatus SS14]
MNSIDQLSTETEFKQTCSQILKLVKERERKCPYPNCSKSYRTVYLTDWFDHLVAGHQSFLYSCEDCDTTFRSRRSGYDHMEDEAADGSSIEHRAKPSAWSRGFRFRQMYEKNRMYQMARQELDVMGRWDNRWPAVLPDFTNFLKKNLGSMISPALLTEESTKDLEPTLQPKFVVHRMRFAPVGRKSQGRQTRKYSPYKATSSRSTPSSV